MYAGRSEMREVSAATSGAQLRQGLPEMSTATSREEALLVGEGAGLGVEPARRRRRRRCRNEHAERSGGGGRHGRGWQSPPGGRLPSSH